MYRGSPSAGQKSVPEVSTFHGRIRRACHIRATVSLPIPYRAAIDLVDQHAEPSSGTVCNVSCTIASTTSSPSTTGRPRPARMRPTAAVPSAANRLRHRRTDFGVDAHRRAISAFETPSVAHNNALAWRTSRAGAVCERASRSSSARCPPVISKAPAAATIPPTTTTDHYLSDTSPVYPMGTLAKCDPFGTPSTSHWTGAAIIVQSPRTKTCIVTQWRTSLRPMPSSLAG